VSTFGSHEPRKTLEEHVVKGLLAEVRDYPVGASLHVSPAADLCYSLEYYLPKLLGVKHPEWESESLDGFFFDTGVKTGAFSAKLGGMTILITDQTVTPVEVEIGLTPTADAIEHVRLKLGEPGGGRLGISGPVCNSREATRLIATFGQRVEDIQWAYRLEVFPSQEPGVVVN
jgi:hypothetical protein